jgi:EAL and modified HD-GYP domain-containing signal transduction protein
MKLNNRFIARQAILDTEAHCIGYELLYRQADTDHATFEDAGQASIQVFDSAHLFGIETLCGDLKAFINCTGEALTSDFVNILPAHRTVLEILETVAPTPDILNACERLKLHGYQLALDDYVFDEKTAAFLPLVDVVKVHIRSASKEMVSCIRERISPSATLLAAKVETKEEYDMAIALGFQLFQGFFFFKPQVMKTRELSPSRISSMRLLQATVNEELDFADLERIIKEDAALCYRFLRFINSAEFCLRCSVQSIRHALALMGERGARRWALLTGTVVAADGKPRELLRCALIRAKLIELIAPQARCSEYEGFLLGLFSLMAAVLDIVSSEISNRIEMPANVSAALAGKDGRLGQLLDVVVSYERCEWEKCEKLAGTLTLDEVALSSAYVQAVKWVSKIPI